VTDAEFEKAYGYPREELRDRAAAGEDIGTMFDGDVTELFW